MLGKKQIFIDPMSRESLRGEKGGKSVSNRKLMIHKDESLDGEKDYSPEKTDSSHPSDDEYEESRKHFEEKYKEGRDEGLKEVIKEQHKNQYKFYGLLNKATKAIAHIKNIIPIFTSEIIVDASKVTIIHRPFFFSEHIQSISIQDISDIWLDTVPFFASLNVIDKTFIDNTIQVKWFWKNDAEKARRIVTGLMETAKEKVDLKTITDESMAEKLEEIGRIQEAKTTVSNA